MKSISSNKKNTENDKKIKVKTAITKIEKDKITTCGYSQKDLIANITYPEMVYLLLKNKLPSKTELKMFNHILVSFCDHGLTPPSTQTARVISSSGSPLNVSVSGALLSFGKNHAGAIKHAMDLFQTALKHISFGNDKNDKYNDKLFNEIAIDIIKHYKENKENVPGFGHRYHDEDPRAKEILQIAKDLGFVEKHSKLAEIIGEQLSDKNIKINIDGANAAILSDMGFNSDDGFGIFIIGRLPGLIAHSIEEKNSEEIFRKIYDLEEIEYIGVEDKKIRRN
jgi:citrate synthase